MSVALGNGATAARVSLEDKILVRIQVPQLNSLARGSFFEWLRIPIQGTMSISPQPKKDFRASSGFKSSNCQYLRQLLAGNRQWNGVNSAQTGDLLENLG
jgi:hypothetical protein